MTVRIPTNVRNAIVAAVATAADAGPAAALLRIYSGAQPASASDAASGVLLATVTMGDPCFGGPTNGVIAAADPPPVDPSASGTAGWFRLVDSTGATVIDGSVSATGGSGDLKLSNTSLAPGIATDITSFTVTAPAG